MPRAVIGKELADIVSSHVQEKQLVFFLDFDGTLVDFQNEYHLVSLPKPVFEVLVKLSAQPRVHIVILSGRTEEYLFQNFPTRAVDLAAERGALFWNKEKVAWENVLIQEEPPWYREVQAEIKKMLAIVPGSQLEEKRFSLVWHYRQAEATLAEHFLQELEARLSRMFGARGIELVHGSKVLEVLQQGVGKGAFVKWYLQKYFPNAQERAVVALGDDAADEEMFAVISSLGGATVKVNQGDTNADYLLLGPEETLSFLYSIFDSVHE